MTKEPGDRLREARRKKGFATATAAANAFGWNPVTYTSHENGTRGLTRDTARKYAHAFGTTIDYLLGTRSQGKEFTETAKRLLAYKPLPCLDWQVMTIGAHIDQRIEKATEYKSIPSDVPTGPNSFVLENIDESMVDKSGDAGVSFRENDLLIIDPECEVEPGDFVIAQVDNCDRWVFRKYKHVGYKGLTPLIELVPLNSSYPTYEISDEAEGCIIGVLTGRLDKFKRK